MSIRVVFLAIICFVAGGCATAPLDLAQAPENTRYCGRYLVYRVCAQDITGDGQVDVMYFEDTQQVFMYSPDTAGEYTMQLALHPCVQIMDQDLNEASNKLLYINSETGFFERADIKSDLMAHYLRYLPKINKCSKNTGTLAKSDQPEQELSEMEDDFADMAFDSLQ